MKGSCYRTRNSGPLISADPTYPRMLERASMVGEHPTQTSLPAMTSSRHADLRPAPAHIISDCALARCVHPMQNRGQSDTNKCS